MNWYYSDSLKKYVSLHPSKNERYVTEAAAGLNIGIEWDDFGNIIKISYADARRIADEIGAYIMTPADYWRLYDEAVKNKNSELLASLKSKFFTEFLDRIYISNCEYIDHPAVGEDGFLSEPGIKEEIVYGRPGWIKPEDIDMKNGHPVSVREKTKETGLIKYWSPDTSVCKEGECYAIRGYVTSSDSISLDLGIPVSARNPKTMIRLCFDTPPNSFLDEEEITEADSLLASGSDDDIRFFSEGDLFKKIKGSDSSECLRIKENLYLKLGKINIRSYRNSLRAVTYSEFKSYIKNIKDTFNDAVREGKSIVFVTGHRNPDSDTVVSSLFEAFRLSAENNGDSIYLPLIQSDYMPAEIEELIRTDTADCLLYESDFDLPQLLKTGLVRFVFTDQNYQSDLQKYVVCVTDHHKLSDSLAGKEFSYPVNIELAGSCSALIACKYAGMGRTFDEELSRMLYGAMLMDTECRVEHKMTDTDRLVMDYMKEISRPKDDYERYKSLMIKLVSEKDVVRLYRRDYKRFKGFGFATLKMTDIFSNDNLSDYLRTVTDLAQKENAENNLYFTIAKISEYSTDTLTVIRERFYLIWNNNSSESLRIKVREQIRNSVCEVFETATVEIYDDYVEVSGTDKQVSRKKIAPDLERLVGELTRFVWADSIGKWVSRDFLKYEEWMKEEAPNAVCNKDGYICNVTFAQAKAITARMNSSMLSLPEYWKVYHEAEEKHDSDLISSLTSGGFIEFLNTVSADGKIINNPSVDGDTFSGKLLDYNIISATPGLICPDEIDCESGLPAVVYSPDEAGESLWRYWSPPEKGTYVFSRSHIFLIDKPCIDAKALPDEAYINIGIRATLEKNDDQ